MSQAWRIARTDGGRLRQASEPDCETAGTRQQTCTGNPWAAITWMAANRRKGPPHLFQQLGGTARDRQLGLQLDDPTPRRHQLLVLVAAQAREQALVDAVLAPPGGDRLGADPQRLGDLGDRPSGLGEVQDLAAELRWVAASSDAVLLSSGSMRNPTTQLHRTGGDQAVALAP